MLCGNEPIAGTESKTQRRGERSAAPPPPNFRACRLNAEDAKVLAKDAKDSGPLRPSASSSASFALKNFVAACEQFGLLQCRERTAAANLCVHRVSAVALPSREFAQAAAIRVILIDCMSALRRIAGACQASQTGCLLTARTPSRESDSPWDHGPSEKPRRNEGTQSWLLRASSFLCGSTDRFTERATRPGRCARR